MSTTDWSALSKAYADAVNQFFQIWHTGSAVGQPREKIRIEPLESPVPKETPSEAPPVETPAEAPQKEPVGA